MVGEVGKQFSGTGPNGVGNGGFFQHLPAYLTVHTLRDIFETALANLPFEDYTRLWQTDEETEGKWDGRYSLCLAHVFSHLVVTSDPASMCPWLCVSLWGICACMACVCVHWAF